MAARPPTPVAGAGTSPTGGRTAGIVVGEWEEVQLVHPALRSGPATPTRDTVEEGLATPASGGEREGEGRDARTIKTPTSGKGHEAPSILSESSIKSVRWKLEGWDGKKAMEDDQPPKTPGSSEDTAVGEQEFTPPTTGLQDTPLDSMEELSFSKRGSELLVGKKAVNGQSRERTSARGKERQQPPELATMVETSLKTLSEEVEKESLKVRSMYDADVDTDWRNGNTVSQSETTVEEETRDIVFDVRLRPRPHTSRGVTERESVIRQEYELAGGVEDWENVRGGDVDRYGFIVRKTEPDDRSGTPEPRPPQRVSTVLQLASEAPRKQRGFGRQISVSRSTRTVPRKTSTRSLHTMATTASARSPSKHPLRTLAHRLPGFADSRTMDEAGDMLTLPPGLSSITEAAESPAVLEAARKREWSRAEKWRRMARVVKREGGAEGGGMEFEFDTQSAKLVERTWKGIPDRWRATAWHSFLSTSARKVAGSPSDAELVEAFRRLVGESSADDVQIDMDVPRTINSHIMFRKRYRGGQRLLFRVLHALALYYPETGYVQGMASLAATLLCYFDEEGAFVMAARMWTLRGLDKLYAQGFDGLMAALDELREDWMRGHDVSRQLVSCPSFCPGIPHCLLVDVMIVMRPEMR